MRDSLLPAGRRKEDPRTVPALEVTVADQGIGIPDGELQAILDKFVQSSKTKTGAGGTGLGLAITREILQQRGSFIEAANQPDGGAVFTFAVRKCAFASTNDDSDPNHTGTPRILATAQRMVPATP